MTLTRWHNCYDGGWGDLITPESFAHPAKFARGLVERIIRHGLERDYWREGELLGDPFGGVALGGIVAAYHGLAWIGVELEEKFRALGQSNIDLHAGKLTQLNAPIPVILKGDSRNFAEIVRGGAGVLTSPPWEESSHNGGAGDQMNNMAVRYQPKGRGKKELTEKSEEHRHYGHTPGNIGNLKSGDLAGICTSPPWEKFTANCPPRAADGKDGGTVATFNRTGKWPEGEDYGQSAGQIGADKGDNYWAAMAEVYAQCLQALRPGGVMAVVIKSYVKNKQIVPLPDQTWQLLLHLGFQPLERVHAMLVKESSTSGLFGEIKTTKARKSFFRRLAESKGSPKIDWEDVLFVRAADPKLITEAKP